MRAIISLVVTLGLAMFMYVIYLRTAAPTPGSTPQQVISTTAVEMKLMNVAQAERTYFVQNYSYATLDQLSSSGTYSLPLPDRDGYDYAVDTSSSGFTVTATHPAVTGLSFPTLSIDQSMQVHRSE